jgi:hypothetical protein
MTRCRCSQNQYKTGRGIVNSLINKLPIELHLPGYQFCGPGTRLQQRINRGDAGINPLDAACKEHDISYSINQSDLEARHRADYKLEQKAWNRVRSKDAKFGEKIAAWLVTNIMKGKRHLGMGCKLSSKSKKKNRRVKKQKTKKNRRKQVAFGSGIVGKVRASIRRKRNQKIDSKNLKGVAKSALLAARKSVKASGGKHNIRTPRVIPVPRVGGILPLIPIFAGLSALGSLAGGAAGIVRAIKSVKNAKEKIFDKGEVSELSLNRKGNGLFLKPYRTGLGLFLGKQKN